MIVSSHISLLLPVLVPLATALLVLLSYRWANMRELITLISGLVLTVSVVLLLPDLTSDQTTTLIVVLAEPLPGVSIAFHLEPLGFLFAGLASFLWLVTSCYAIGYMRGLNEDHQPRFYCFMALAIACTMGIALSANMFTLFVFYELLTLATFPLVTHKGSVKAKRAGRLYLGILMGASMMLLMPAMIWTWSITGTLEFQPGGILAGKTSSVTLHVLFVLYIFGIAKAAIVPLHMWLPAAMVAPTPVSALLHAVAVVKAGVFTILKIVVYIFGSDLINESGISQWLMYFVATAVFWSALMACRQDNLKLRLAYSTVSQLGYIVLGALMANRWGITGAGLHVVTHACGKITLFFCAGAIFVSSGKREVSQMQGIGRQMPFTMLAFFLASLSIIGLPPLGGLWSKWLLLQGGLAAEQFFVVTLLVLSSVLSVVYLLPITIRAFIQSAPDTKSGVNSLPFQEGEKAAMVFRGIKEAPVSCLVAMAVSIIACFSLFFFSSNIYNFLETIVGR